jgi:hypothetical protein
LIRFNGTNVLFSFEDMGNNVGLIIVSIPIRRNCLQEKMK